MKLRIQGNSLRLRLGPSEIRRLLGFGRIEETIRFANHENATLTYALEVGDLEGDISVRHAPCAITVLLDRTRGSGWAESDQVSISARIDVGGTILSVLVEKDFACLSHDDAGNEDTFPNPNAHC